MSPLQDKTRARLLPTWKEGLARPPVSPLRRSSSHLLGWRGQEGPPTRWAVSPTTGQRSGEHGRASALTIGRSSLVGMVA